MTDSSQGTLPSGSTGQPAGAGPLERLLGDCDERLTRHVDETDYRNLPLYLERARLRFAAGRPPTQVLDDLFMAARCLHGRAGMHLARTPSARFLTRRVQPVELGLLCGQPSLTLELAEEYGLSFAVLLGREDAELSAEVAPLTRYFERLRCDRPEDLAGLGAVAFACALAGMARGFDDEAAMALNAYGEVRRAFRPLPDAEPAAALRRYDTLGLAAAAIINREPERLAAQLGAMTGVLEAEHRPTDAPPEGPLLSLPLAALLATAVLKAVPATLPPDGAAASHQGLYEALMAAPVAAARGATGEAGDPAPQQGDGGAGQAADPPSASR